MTALNAFTHRIGLKIKSSTRGFTIIELLVVFSLIGVVSGIGVISLVSYGRTQAIEQGAADLKSTIELAKNNALAHAKPSDTCTHLGGYRVVLHRKAGGYNYQLFALCPDASNLVEAAPGKYFPNEIDFDTSVNLGCTGINFYTVTNTFTCTRGVNNEITLPATLIIKGYSNALTRHVTIDSGGNITITKP